MLYGLPPAENDGSRIRRWFYPVILSGFHSPPMRIIKCPLRYFAAKVGQRFDLSKKSCIFYIVHCYSRFFHLRRESFDPTEASCHTFPYISINSFLYIDTECSLLSANRFLIANKLAPYYGQACSLLRISLYIRRTGF